MDIFWTHRFIQGENPNVSKVWTYYGHILDTLFVLDMFWTHYGHLLDTFGVWTHFGHLSRISVQNVSIGQLLRSTLGWVWLMMDDLTWYLLGRLVTCSEGFVNCFLRVPQAVGLYCSCHAAQASKGNYWKTHYKTRGTSGRPNQY